jgi:hypothetical protein
MQGHAGETGVCLPWLFELNLQGASFWPMVASTMRTVRPVGRCDRLSP